MPRISIITGKIIPDIAPKKITLITPTIEPMVEVKQEVKEEIKISELKEEPKETIINESPVHVNAPSLIIPDEEDKSWTALQVDSQEFSTFLGCPRKYDFVFNRHLQSVDGVNAGISKGTITHAGLREYWKEMLKSGDYQEATKACIKQAKGMIEKDIRYSLEDKLTLLQSILDFLKWIQTYNWIPIEVEKFFKFKAYEDPNLKIRIYLTGRIDLTVKTPQLQILPIDFKTESDRWFYSEMSNQFRIYALACEVNLLGVQRIGFQTTLEPKDKYKLEVLPFDQDVLDEFRLEILPYWAKQMLLAHEDNIYPPNTTNCVHGHFKCQFSDGAEHKGICNISRSIREQKLLRYFSPGEPWDPSKED